MPWDLGAARRGTDMGPIAMRYAGLYEALGALGLQVVDGGCIEVPVSEGHVQSQPRLRYLPEIVTVCRDVAGVVGGILSRHAMPLILGGDHSVTIGMLAGRRTAGLSGGVIWLDAHGDFNTEETSPSGNIHGMALAVATGRGVADLVRIGRGSTVTERQTVIVGVRSVDRLERAVLHQSEVTVFTMKDIDQRGIGAVVTQAIAVATDGGAQRFHLSVDLDVLDPLYAPGVGTRVRGGLTYREAHLEMELASDSGLVGSMDVVELNPTLDERNCTATLAVELIASALGEGIY